MGVGGSAGGGAELLEWGWNGHAFDPNANLYPLAARFTSRLYGLTLRYAPGVELVGAVRDCVGQARVLEGNPATVGAPLGRGAFNYGRYPIPVRAGSGAVIPSQFGAGMTNAGLFPYADSIFGFIGGPHPASFSGITDVIGSRQVSDVRRVLQSTYPNTFIVELVTGSDLKIAPISLWVPNTLECPTGTHEAW